VRCDSQCSQNTAYPPKNCFMRRHISTIFGDQTLTLLDVGAAGDIERRWRRISPLTNYIGFEPDELSYQVLLNKPSKCASYTLFPKAVLSKKEKKYHLCKGWQQSSHFPPNFSLVDLFPQQDRLILTSNSLLIPKKLIIS